MTSRSFPHDSVMKQTSKARPSTNHHPLTCKPLSVIIFQGCWKCYFFIMHYQHH